MISIRIRSTTLDDIDLLIKLRIDFLVEENTVSGHDDIKMLEDRIKTYLIKAIPDGGFIAVVAEEDGQALGTAFLSISERPPRSAATTNLLGTVHNVYTYPHHRRKGIASKVMKALLEEAKAAEVATINLLATDSGKPLYDKLGFQIEKYTAMRLRLSSGTS